MNASDYGAADKLRPFHAIVLLTLCLIPLASCSLPLSTASIFYPSVVSYLGLSSTAELSVYQTFMSFAQIVTLIFAGKIIAKHDVRLVLTLSSLAIGLPFLAMSAFGAVWQWYIAGVVQGIGIAFNLYVAIPTLINRWFANRIGFLVGLCMAFSSIGGIVFNLVAGWLVGMGPEGWRTGYLVFGIITLVTTVPFTIFGLRSFPSDVGLVPYAGGEKGAKTAVSATQNIGLSFRQATRKPAFWGMVLYAGITTFTAISMTILPTYAGSLAQTFPETAANAALLLSMVSIGGMVGKFTLGAVCDKSCNLAIGLAVGSGVIGYLLIWFLPGNLASFLAGGFLFGLFFSTSTVVPPIICRTSFGNADYSNIWSRTSTFAQVFGALANAVWGLLAFGDFSVYFIAALAGMVASCVLGFYAVASGKKVISRVIAESASES